MRKFAHIVLFAVFFTAENSLAAQMAQTAVGVSWYRSNLSGMTLESIPSRIVALRNEYCVSVERIHPVGIFYILPPILQPYYNDSYSVELRILYEKGKEFRRQWIFRDAKGAPMLTASGNEVFFEPADEQEDEAAVSDGSSGFIELREAGGAAVRELRYEEDKSEWDYRYSYRENVLVITEIWYKSESDFVLLYTDSYHYNRSGGLRAIERVIHEDADGQSRIAFPRLGPGVSLGDAFVTRGIAYTSDFLLDITAGDDITITYAMDSRGRIEREVWRDSDGVITGEFINTWSADRLISVLWKAPNDERLVEYEYDNSGDRIMERNTRRGVLERTITHRNGLDVEEIYLEGRLVLRTHWEKGLKISEERFLSGETR